jgi:hypothetical protein
MVLFSYRRPTHYRSGLNAHNQVVLRTYQEIKYSSRNDQKTEAKH